MFETTKISPRMFLISAVFVVAACSDSPVDVPDVPVLPGDDADGGSDAARGDGGPGGDGGDVTSGPYEPAKLELTEEPYTSLQRVWAPVEPSSQTDQAIEDGDLKVTDIDRYLEEGLGVEAIDGKDWIEHTELAPGYPGPDVRGRRSLLYFWQSADPQLIDEESPVRFEGVTQAPVGSTYRPHDHLTTQIYTSHVQSARRISEASGHAFDFAFVAGDFTDGGQRNEVQWTLDILAGGRIDPDSGVDNDPVPGPANDFSDPFESPGIGVPWYIAIGNHETLYAGTLRAGEKVQNAAVGTEIYEFKGRVPGSGIVTGLENGFRDASTRYADVVREGTTPADQNRRIVQPENLLEMIRRAPGAPDDHGLSERAVSEGRGYFSFYPRSGKPIRFVVLDTLQFEPPQSGGGMDKPQFEWLKSELKNAGQNDELVIVGGHHRLSDFAPVSEIPAIRIKRLLASHDNLLMYLVGHGHRNTKRKIDGVSGARGFWELMCASTVDFPLQTRIIEVVYDGNGYLSIYVTNLGHNAPEGSSPHWARELAAGQGAFFSDTDAREQFENQHDASNLLLRYKLPAEFTSAIENESWPYRIESLETLAQFSAPE